MSIRYVRRGLQVVRVVDATRPVLSPPEPTMPSITLEEASALIRAAAEGLRAEQRRRRDWGFQRRTPPRSEGRDVTGAQLLAARQAVGLSQRDLAAEWPYGRSLVADVERGRRSCPPDLGAWAKHVLRVTRKEVPG